MSLYFFKSYPERFRFFDIVSVVVLVSDLPVKASICIKLFKNILRNKKTIQHK